MSESTRLIEAGSEEFARWQPPEMPRGLRPPRTAVRVDAPAPTPPPSPAAVEEVSVETAPPLNFPTAEELEAIRLQARAEGYAEGHAEGFAQGQAEGRHRMDERAAELGALIQALEQPFREMDREVEEQLTRLAVLLARQIIRRELHIDDGQIVAVVREALGLLPVNARHIRVLLNPEDAALVRAHVAGVDEAWSLVEDSSISRGGCQVISASSRIDSTLERRFNQLAAQLLGDERAQDATRCAEAASSASLAPPSASREEGSTA